MIEINAVITFSSELDEEIFEKEIIDWFDKRNETIGYLCVHKKSIFIRVQIEGKPTDVILELKNYLNREMGKKYHVGARKIIIPRVLMYPIRNKIDLEYIYIDGNVATIYGIDEKALRNNNLNRMYRILTGKIGEIG